MGMNTEGVCVGIQITEKTIKTATKCDKQFSCLSHKTRDVCPVTHANGQNVLIIESKPHPCPYKITFGSSEICLCPVRYELFARHDI
ncbi:MAG: hypothetical protein ACP5G0_08530 [Desulfomonilia bacterium]